MTSQPNGDIGEVEFYRLWNCAPPMPIIPFGISLRVALRHDSLSRRHPAPVPISHATMMTGSTDQTMDRDEIGATTVQPRMGDDDRKRRGGDTGLPGAPGNAVITKTKPQVKRPNMYRVLLLNDDYTPMEFVVDVLQRFLNQRMIINNENLHRSPLHEMKMRALSRASLSSPTDFMPTRYPVNCRKLQVPDRARGFADGDADKAAQDQYLVTGSLCDGPA